MDEQTEKDYVTIPREEYEECQKLRREHERAHALFRWFLDAAERWKPV